MMTEPAINQLANIACGVLQIGALLPAFSIGLFFPYLLSLYLASKNADNNLAFGSTRSLGQPNEVIFLNCPFPTLEADAVPIKPATIGQGHARRPYTPGSPFNISGLSFGTISKPAVKVLSRGATAAGISVNTGESGLSPYHLDGGRDLVVQTGTAKYGVRNDEGEPYREKLAAIAHTCGVTEARQLRRRHAQLIDARGIPGPLESLYPTITPRPEYLLAATNTGATR